jgi:hypothetical protein
MLRMSPPHPTFMAPTRALRAWTPLLVWGALTCASVGCAHVSQPHVTLHRSLPAPLLTLEVGAETLSTSITFQGKLVRHANVLLEDAQGFELVLQDRATGDLWKLRYALPGARKIPIPTTGEVRIILEGPSFRTPGGASKDASYLGLRAFDADGTLLALVNESEAMSPKAWSPWVTLNPGREITYRETMQWEGACLEVRAHGRVQFQGNQDENFRTLDPGMSARLETDTGPYQLTLIDHARTMRTNCLNPPGDRLSFMLLRL